MDKVYTNGKYTIILVPAQNSVAFYYETILNMSLWLMPFLYLSLNTLWIIALMFWLTVISFTFCFGWLISDFWCKNISEVLHFL